MNYGSLPCRDNLFIHTATFVESRNRRPAEATPLISLSYRRFGRPRNSESFFNWKILLLLLFLICGALIGIHLLFVEYKEITANFPYYLIELKSWYHNQQELKSSRSIANVSKLNLPVKNVIITQTMSEQQCITIQSCSLLITSMITLDLFDIPFNFVISTGGETYEIRGWDFESGFTNSINNESVVIAFIGNFTSNQLADAQLAEFDAFISEAIRGHQLLSDFNIYGIQNDSLKIYDRFKVRQEWKGVLL